MLRMTWAWANVDETQQCIYGTAIYRQHRVANPKGEAIVLEWQMCKPVSENIEYPRWCLAWSHPVRGEDDIEAASVVNSPGFLSKAKTQAETADFLHYPTPFCMDRNTSDSQATLNATFRQHHGIHGTTGMRNKATPLDVHVVVLRRRCFNVVLRRFAVLV